MQAVANNVEIVKFAAFYNEGFRGNVLGQAPQNDKVWGLAKVRGHLVAFWGRRNGTLKIKPYYSNFEALDKFNEKIGGRKKGDIYTAISNPDMIRTLSPRLLSDVASAFNSKFH